MASESSRNSAYRQLPLAVHLRDEATLENFLPGPDAQPLLGVLRQQLEVDGEPVVYLHGAQGSGKSHLLQACCHLAGSSALYLPLAELASCNPVDVLAGGQEMQLLCLDDLDAVVGDEEWERALFNVYNLARESGCRLLLAASAPPRRLAVDLADLRSRLAWGVVYHLPVADDERRCEILEFRARRRGLELPREVATYLVTRAPRAMDNLLTCLSTLDKASLAHKRAISIPFVKQILDL